MAADQETPQVVSTDCASCDNCGICHLASSGYLLVSAASPLPAGETHQPVATLSLVPPSHIGDPPQRPPRRLN